MGFFGENMMKIDADEFMNTNPVRKRISILEPFRDEIFKLKYAGYSIRQIAEFLALNNVAISQNALDSFIKARQKTAPRKTKKADSTAVSVKANSVAEPSNENPAAVSAAGQGKHQPTELAKKRELVEVGGRVVDVGYKPSWVGDDINLKDLV